MLNDDQRELLTDLLDEYVSRIESDTLDLPDRITVLIQQEIILALSVRQALNPPPPDPELERLLHEEEEIEAFDLFQREIQQLTGNPNTISFAAWRSSPLNPVKDEVVS